MNGFEGSIGGGRQLRKGLGVAGDLGAGAAENTKGKLVSGRQCNWGVGLD